MSLGRIRCIFQDFIAKISSSDSPAVDDNRSASPRVEAVHFAMEGQERVGELGSSQVRPTGEVKMAHTSHLFQSLFHNIRAAQNRTNECNISYIYYICYVRSTYDLFIFLLTSIFKQTLPLQTCLNNGMFCLLNLYILSQLCPFN